MKLNLIVLSLCIMLGTVNAFTFGQQITLKRSSTSFEHLIKELEKQSGHSFFYKKEDVNSIKPLSVDFRSESLKSALDEVAQKAGLSYDVFGNTVVFKKNANKPVPAVPSKQKEPEVLSPVLAQQQYITGKVVDVDNNPLTGVSVTLKSNPRQAVTTNQDGVYSLPLSAEGQVVVFSYVGFQSRESVVTQEKELVIQLRLDEQSIEDVIVTGIVERKKDSFTGATSSFSGEELKAITSQSVVHALRSVDPAFVFVENNLQGANPNSLPTIELRGQSGISIESMRNEFSVDPNQPLFILDGFESNLRTIMDLDMNIIASVTILKDAASTALYGSKASNGVVVVETVKPKVGKIAISYATDLRTELSDLRSYNMMNAAEKLEFERLSGRYTSNNPSLNYQLELDDLYNRRLAEVQRGVNTYWLKQPLQNGFSHRHSVSARGGEGAVLFDMNVNYRNTKGVMKKSGRDDWGASMNLTYRAGKINFSNRAFITGAKGEESPFGSFSTWVNANPYYRLLGPDEPWLADEPSKNAGFNMRVANPFYNANLSSFDETKNFQISNNLQMNVDFSPGLRLSVGGQISKGVSDNKIFTSPLHTRFLTVENRRRGEYIEGKTENFSYTGNTMLTYAKTLDKHSFTGNARVELREDQNRLSRYTAIGFPPAANGNPVFSFGYPEGGRPAAATSVTRSNSFIFSANYSYDQRYNADISFNMNGTTAFGSNKKHQSYYAAGLSWNAHKESFLSEVTWIDLLRLRGNIGMTGNQNFSNVSESVYNYYQTINRFGQGIYLSALGAPDLKWQSTLQTSLGLDGTLFQKRVNFQLNAFRKYTSPLVVSVTLPSSTGLNNYPFNAGALTADGLEFMLNYSPIYKPAERFTLTFGVMGSMMKQRYSKFDNRMETLNKELQESNSLKRYRDGADPRDLWAVRSMGIDPATGREIFLTKDGEYTFTYNADDQVIAGNEQPFAEGVFNTNLSYKGFTAGLVIRYIWKKDIMNSALFNKVENISLSNVENNQDKRALYDRWKAPGDNAPFRGIHITESTPMSSRFIQEESTLSGESISLGYQFQNSKWLDQIGIANLRLTGYMNEIFHISTVRRERGIDYPFARSVSISLSANFK